ncbi:MAG: hypothetical protein K9L62_02105 [Vallitaleaceae bacterium]|nr:hypothetical protein [Vallitaleaceae bacterium]
MKHAIKDLNEDQVFKQGYMANMTLVLLVLNDKFDFTEEQLDKFIDELSNLLDSHNKEYVTIGDICNVLKDETGITVNLS